MWSPAPSNKNLLPSISYIIQKALRNKDATVFHSDNMSLRSLTLFGRNLRYGLFKQAYICLLFLKKLSLVMVKLSYTP